MKKRKSDQVTFQGFVPLTQKELRKLYPYDPISYFEKERDKILNSETKPHSFNKQSKGKLASERTLFHETTLKNSGNEPVQI